MFAYPNQKQGPLCCVKPLARTKDYVGALEDLDLALQIEPANPFPQCCRAEADSCSCFCLQKTSRKRWVEDYRDH